MIGKSLKLYVFSRLQDAITFTDTRNIIFHSETTKKLKSTSNPPLSPGPLSPGPLSPGPHLFTITSHVSETACVICNQAMYSVMHIQQNETHQVSIAPVHIIHLLKITTKNINTVKNIAATMRELNGNEVPRNSENSALQIHQQYSNQGPNCARIFWPLTGICDLSYPFSVTEVSFTCPQISVYL